MKRLLSILSAGVLALMAFSCTEELATFDSSKIDAPVLGTYDLTEEALTVNFTPAVYGLDFNKDVPLNYALAFVSVDNKEVSKIITASRVNGNVITLSVNNLIKALATYGYAPGDNANFELVVRATTQDPSKDTGINGYVDSEGRIKFVNYTLTEYVKPQQEDPYAGMTEPSDWSVIGSIASTGNSWNQDEAMLTNGEWHLCRGIVLSTADEFKFRFEGGWGTNYGLEGEEPVVVELDQELKAVAGGVNIKVPEDGTYDLLLNPEDELIKVVKAVAAPDPYEQYSEDSDWSLIGSMTLLGHNWNFDFPMKTDGEEHIAIEVPLAANDEVKFRFKGGWATNFGYAEGVNSYELEEDFVVAQNGGNIIIAETGVYNLFLNPDAATARIEFVKEYTGEEPEPQEPDVNGEWTLVGDINSWNVANGLASEKYGSWKLVQNVTIGTHHNDDTGNDDIDAVKWVMDGSWDVNFGLVKGAEFAGLGEEMEAAFGGDNIVVPEAGAYDFYLDPKAKKIMVKAHTDDPLPPIDDPTASSWGVTGSIASAGISWDKDIEMTIDGDWHIAKDVVLATTDAFKFRLYKDQEDPWAVNVGADGDVEPFVVEINTEITGKNGGKNLAVPADGTYDLYLNPETLVFKVVGQEPEDPNASSWGVTGSIASAGISWDKDIEMTIDGDWHIAKDVVLASTDQFKFRLYKDQEDPWAVNVGADGDVEPFVVEINTEITGKNGGKNLAVPSDGTYDLYLNPETLVFKVVGASEPEPPTPPTPAVVKFYIDNQTGQTDLLLWSWDALGSLKSGDTWPTSGMALTEKETVNEKEYLVFSADTDVVKGQACAFLLVTPDGTWQTNDCKFTVAEDAEACFFIAKEDKTIEIVSGTVTEPVDPNASPWTVTGSIASAGLNWNGDIDMTVEGEWHIAKNVALTTSDEFKFRKDKGWAVNIGAEGDAAFTVTVGEQYTGKQDGKNLKVPADGTYDLYLNPETSAFKVVETPAVKALSRYLHR